MFKFLVFVIEYFRRFKLFILWKVDIRHWQIRYDTTWIRADNSPGGSSSPPALSPTSPASPSSPRHARARPDHIEIYVIEHPASPSRRAPRRRLLAGFALLFVAASSDSTTSSPGRSYWWLLLVLVLITYFTAAASVGQVATPGGMRSSMKKYKAGDNENLLHHSPGDDEVGVRGALRPADY